jgi:hypothetical protein
MIAALFERFLTVRVPVLLFRTSKKENQAYELTNVGSRTVRPRARSGGAARASCLSRERMMSCSRLAQSASAGATFTSITGLRAGPFAPRLFSAMSSADVSRELAGAFAGSRMAIV